ncbi:c-type cytochrome [Roseomonas sp. BN140053]|uniref:c-type cytochrome n=1 Tax=Roseomonas sp. BN140053 TaxID=3391898 RepID=UPI0039EA1476
MRPFVLALLLSLPSLAAGAQEAAAPDGAQLFRAQCGACHGMDARNRVGPGLAGVWERRAAAVEGFRYSPALRAKAEGGLSWDEENLRAYLRNPRELVPGGSMPYPGLRDEARLTALVNWIRDNGGKS